MKTPLRWFALLFALAPLHAQEHPDRVVQPNVPQGKITSGKFAESKLYPGTTRDYSVYVPAQYKPEEPAALMVFMDGNGYANPKGGFRVPVVFDNLIHKKEMPVTIAVFVNPGSIPATMPGAAGRSTRSYEYDSMGDRNANFLVNEFLPVALKGLNVTKDPAKRGVCGISSSGIAAFTVAWEKPDQFGLVLSHIGSFTNIRGGWEYPGLVRKSQKNPKAIKVYLQDGKDDLNNLHGNWPLANQDLAMALQFAGYKYKLEMTDGGHSGKFGGEGLPEALKWLWNEKAESTKLPHVETKPEWKPHPDAVAQDGVPKGKVEQMPVFESKVFPNTTRDWSIYVPAQYKADKPAALMVFQDGEGMKGEKGRWRVPIVFDNLIAKGEMPPTIAVFINPGHEKDKPRVQNKHSNRGFEYDSLGDRYARFLLEEIIPEVKKKYSISDDPEMHAIGGSSSGAICAFTAAWERTDYFRKVYSSVGSFTNLRGGNVYPSLVRKTEPKPIRVYMADTSGDVDNAFGSWPWANQLMHSALKYMGYDVRFDWAEGYAHNADFGGSKFPDAMKWLWRKEKPKTVLDTKGDLGGDLTLLNLLVRDQSWEVVAKDLGFADALASDKAGNVYYCDMKAPSIVRIGVDGSKKEICREAVSGMKFNADESLIYGCQGAKSRVVTINPSTGEVKVIAEGVKPNDMAVTKDGFILITETAAGQVTRIDPKTGKVEVAEKGLGKPNGITLSPDGGTLAVSDYGGAFTWLLRVNAGGVLDAKMPNMPMRLAIDPKGEFKFNEPPPYQPASAGDGAATDKAGRYYVTSKVGVQIFDPTGRPCGVLPKPDESQPLTSCVLAGPDHSTLYIANGKTIYRRTLTVVKPKP
jgi:enterochelin esterase family protein